MEKDTLRNQLFDRYFAVENGILATELVDTLSFLPQMWKKLHVLCEKNIKHFNSLSKLEGLKVLTHNQSEYLIIKLYMLRYVIIDLKTKKNITQEEFKNKFDTNFFVTNFGEINTQNDSSMYWISSYNGDIQELIDFYIENKDLLSLPGEIYYRLEQGNAWTYFFIDFINAKAQMGFQTPDQFLYEHLFFNYDLTAFGMQDTQNKIGVERTQEMFDKIKELKLPIEVIPESLYKQFLEHCNIKKNKLEKLKEDNHG